MKKSEACGVEYVTVQFGLKAQFSGNQISGLIDKIDVGAIDNGDDIIGELREGLAQRD